MPLYNNSLELNLRRRKCDAKLKELLDIIETDDDRRRLYPQIEIYFAYYFNKTTNEAEGTAIIRQYELFLTLVSDVQQGLLSREDALKKLDEEMEDNKFAIIADNILKVCEILFWSTVAGLAYGACFTIAGALSVNPVVGVVAMIGLFILCIVAIDNAVECLDEFKTFDQDEKLGTIEKQYIGFFKDVPSKESKSFTQNEDEFDADLSSSMSHS